MDVSDYQLFSKRTLVDSPGRVIPDSEIIKVWCALGLAGEAGEVAEAVKKGVFHQVEIPDELIKKEIGDVMWYVASLCTLYGLSLSDVLAENVEKLRRRYPDGFVPGGGNR